jgi:hypothetical protein
MKKILENVHCKGFYLDVYEEGWFNKKYIAICPNFSFYYEGMDKSEALVGIMASFEKAVDEELKKRSQMITYEYRGYVLEMSLVGEQSSIRVKGIVPTHRHITFFDEDISRMKSQFESFVDSLF